jgi:hypothetical protein
MSSGYNAMSCGVENEAVTISVMRGEKLLTGGQKSSWKSTTMIAGLNSDSPMMEFCLFD